MTLIRKLGAVALIVAAVAVWFGMAPEDAARPDHSKAVAAIESADDDNNASADGAPQQTVVNGWTTLEYLQLLSRQLDQQASPPVRDERPAAMLLLVVVGIALIALTLPVSPDGHTTRATHGEPVVAPAASPTHVAKADWYPDPNRENTKRYWDGTKWTERRKGKHAQDGGTPQLP